MHRVVSFRLISKCCKSLIRSVTPNNEPNVSRDYDHDTASQRPCSVYGSVITSVFETKSFYVTFKIYNLLHHVNYCNVIWWDISLTYIKKLKKKRTFEPFVQCYNSLSLTEWNYYQNALVKCRLCINLTPKYTILFWSAFHSTPLTPGTDLSLGKKTEI